MTRKIAVGVLWMLVTAGAALAVEPIATVGTNWSGIEIDLMALERKGNILTVKWTVRNVGKESPHIQFALTGRAIDTYVVDQENGTKYYALTDQEGNGLASSHTYVGHDSYGIDNQILPGVTQRYWAKFPAPPPEVTTASVFFAGADPIEDVAIAEK